MSNEVERRLRELKENIEIEISLIEQKQNYGIAVSYFKDEFNLDSTKVYLTKSDLEKKITKHLNPLLIKYHPKITINYYF